MLISNNIEKLDNIWASTKVLEYFNLSFDLQKNVEELIDNTNFFEELKW